MSIVKIKIDLIMRDKCEYYLRRTGAGGLEIDVANEAVAGLLGLVVDRVDSDVDDNGTVAQPRALDEERAANGGNNNVRSANDGGEVSSLAVAHGDGGVHALFRRSVILVNTGIAVIVVAVE